MQCTTRLRVYQLGLVMLHALVVLSILGLALVGQMPTEAAGWLIRPVAAGGQAGRRPTAWLCVWRPDMSPTRDGLRQCELHKQKMHV